MKKVSSIILVMVLLILPIMSFSSCEKEEIITTVGTIEYVKSKNDSRYIYIRPLEQSENALWIPIRVSASIGEESGGAELSVGSVVKVVYNITKDENMPMFAYNAVSIGSADVALENKSPLRLTKGYNYANIANEGTRDFGEIVHVAKIDSPINGYLIYLDNTRVHNDGLTVYFIDGGAIEHNANAVFPNTEIRGRIESFETGYKIAVYGLDQYPFSNLTVQSVGYVTMYNPDYHW